MKLKRMNLPRTIYDVRDTWLDRNVWNICKGFGCFIFLYYVFIFFYFMNYSSIEKVFGLLILIFIIYLWYFMIKYRDNKKIRKMDEKINLDEENQIL